MIDDEQHARGQAGVMPIDQYRAFLKSATILFQDDISGGLHQWMAGMNQACHWRIDPLFQANMRLIEADPLIAA